ncbi:MAG: M48 family metallopeptidase [Acidobacteriaceae bacterium]
METLMNVGDLAYALTRRRRRSLCLQVQEDLSLRVLAPLRASRSEIDAFVRAQQGWIERKRLELAARGPGVAQLPPDGAVIPLLDTQVRFRRGLQSRGVRRDTETLWVPGDDQQALRALKNWYRDELRAEALVLLGRWGPAVGRQPSALVIREQKTRWGSCSHQGAIALNWRLALGPSTLLEYVVVHELCHLIHPHHRPPFWQEVGRVLPDYATRRAALRRFGATWFLAPEPGAAPAPPTTAESASE